MQLYRHHSGTHAIQVGRTPEGLDVTASRRGDTAYLHVVNTLRAKSVSATMQIEGQTARAGRVFEIVGDPMVELSYLNSADTMATC